MAITFIEKDLQVNIEEDSSEEVAVFAFSTKWGVRPSNLCFYDLGEESTLEWEKTKGRKVGGGLYVCMFLLQFPRGS